MYPSEERRGERLLGAPLRGNGGRGVDLLIVPQSSRSFIRVSFFSYLRQFRLRETRLREPHLGETWLGQPRLAHRLAHGHVTLGQDTLRQRLRGILKEGNKEERQRQQNVIKFMSCSIGRIHEEKV